MRMKNFLLGITALFILTSCSSNGSSQNSKDGSFADTALGDEVVGMVEEVIGETDSASGMNVESDTPVVAQSVDIDKLYKSGLVLKKGKASKKWIGDQTDPDITLPVTITNNTGVDLSPEDYIISYKIEFIGQDSDGLLDGFTKNATKRGPHLANGESATVKLFERCVLAIKGPKVKLKISKEELLNRLQGAN